jgi:hypothetical protein
MWSRARDAVTQRQVTAELGATPQLLNKLQNMVQNPSLVPLLRHGNYSVPRRVIFHAVLAEGRTISKRILDKCKKF